MEEFLSQSDFNSRIEDELQDILRKDERLRSVYHGGLLPSWALTVLTGVDSKTMLGLPEFRDVDGSPRKAFSTKGYSDQELKIYNRIEKELKLNKVVSVGFKGDKLSGKPQKLSDSEVAAYVITLSRGLKANAKGCVKCLLDEGFIPLMRGMNWFGKHDMAPEDLQVATDEERRKFILDNVDIEKFGRVSKTKSGIYGQHTYLILDTIEHGGYKYIIFKNPHNEKTKIDYRKSHKLPPKISLPQEISRAKNECMMELGDFCERVASITYSKGDIPLGSEESSTCTLL